MTNSNDVAIQQRLLNSAETLFMNNEYNRVSIREIARQAGSSSSMISYYFGGKHTLYNCVIKHQYDILSDVIRAAMKSDGTLDYRLLFRNCYQIMTKKPELAPFLVRIIIYRESPGYHYLKSLLSQGQEMVHLLIRAEQEKGTIRPDADLDVLRVVSMSLSAYPVLFQTILKDQISDRDFEQFLDGLAEFAARIYEYGIRP